LGIGGGSGLRNTGREWKLYRKDSDYTQRSDRIRDWRAKQGRERYRTEKGPPLDTRKNSKFVYYDEGAGEVS